MRIIQAGLLMGIIQVGIIFRWDYLDEDYIQTGIIQVRIIIG